MSFDLQRMIVQISADLHNFEKSMAKLEVKGMRKTYNNKLTG